VEVVSLKKWQPFLPFEQLEIILIKGFQGRSVVPVLKAVEEMEES
jgi:hypothetical protein